MNTRRGDLVVAGDARRRKIREAHGNGVDGVEVRDAGKRLIVFFLEHAPAGLRVHNIRIDGPPGTRPVKVVAVRRAAELDPELEDRLVVDLHRPGSAGSYRLSIVEPTADGRPGKVPYDGIDPRYAEAGFVFDLDAPRPPIAGRPGGFPRREEDVSYLARDYEGLRQLMLDRLMVTMPQWRERHVPDVFVTLVELLAYVGDDLSYYEDAVATEAYLQTARRRVSVRRHARLTGYRLLEGCHARAWVCIEVSAPLELALDQVRFAATGSRLVDNPPVIDASAHSTVALAGLQQYTPLPARLGPSFAAPAQTALRPAHNAIGLWSWGETEARLLAGATSAVLVDDEHASVAGKPARRQLRLAAGDVLVLEETGDPATGGLGPPDPAHRQAVRLTHVREAVDELYRQPLLEVTWAPEDALSFDLVLRAGGASCARASANAVLVAHGVAATEQLDLGAARLGRPGLSFSAPFPDADLVARHQARRLRALYHAWRRQVEAWRRDALGGRALGKPRLDALRVQFGAEALEELGFAGSDRDDDDDDESRAAREAFGLAELLARADRLLADRRRRLEVLARLAEASGPLAAALVDELEEDWGRELARPLLAGHPAAWGPASAASSQDPAAAVPVIELSDGSAPGAHVWSPAVDLIGTAPTERALVAEVDDERIATLRISAPPQSGALEATYWVGNGVEGNAEAESINAVVWLGSGTAGLPPAGAGFDGLSAIVTVRNPLPASGGIEPEDPAQAKPRIPGAFLERQPRALRPEDYAALAESLPGVRRAAAQLRFTGSLAVAEVAVAPALGEDPDPALLASVQRALEVSRRIGHVVRVKAPDYRPVLLAIQISLVASAVRAEAADELAALLSSGWLADGTPALFHPQRLAFAATVYASPIIAAVHAVPGVGSALLTKFEFLGEPPRTSPTGQPGPRVADALSVGALEIARLDNDPTAPEHGYAIVSLEGGR